MSFKTNLQSLRAQRNMTQEQLAMLLGVSRQAISKWESEKAYPEMDKLLVICDLFGCTLDDLVLGDVNRPGQAAADSQQSERTHHEESSSNHESGTGAGSVALPDRDTQTLPADVTGYDQERRSFALKIASGVALILCGVAACRLFDVEDGGWLIASSSFSEFLVTVSMFIGIALGLALLIPAGLAHSDFRRRHPYVEDFYADADRSYALRRLGFAVAGGIALILLGVAIVVLDDNAFAESIMLLCIAAAVFGFVYYGISYGLLNINEYNAKEDEPDLTDTSGHDAETLHERKRQKAVVNSICSIIMAIATVIALLALFGWHGELQIGSMTLPFWIPWVIGGVLSGLTEPMVTVLHRR
ncbi:helix-turn-helix transcriptional regulator [Bifidobacterium aquikefiricola]|uniref:Helix-turn-helix domain-containing protein n=1 Tax=Bifidobacterium aquikefiricola TaxID=3059038 RepID=A0AB39U5N8_9BIFI